jgi:4-amino-4-deoxy-L-arabinose transferase-like glycosyltransferase
LVGGDGYVSTSYRANPVLPGYLAAVFFIFGESYLLARLGQCLFGALTCVFVYRTATLLAGRAVGILSGVLLSLYLPHVYLSGVFYVECLFIFFATLSIYLASEIATGNARFTSVVLCGVSCGCTVLTRPIFAVYIPLIGLAWVYCAWPRWRRQVFAGVGLLLAASVTIFPWAIRNYFVFDRMLPVTSGFFTTLWQGNNPLALGDADDRLVFAGNRYWEERINRIDAEEGRQIEATYGEVASLLQDIRREDGDLYLIMDVALKPVVLDYIREHPLRVFELSIRRLLTLFSAFTPTSTTNRFTSGRNRILAAVTFYPMLALALVGAGMGLRGQRSLSILYCYIGSMCVAYAALTTCTRFRLPLDPYLIVFGSFAVVRIRDLLPTIAQRAAARPTGSTAAFPQNAMGAAKRSSSRRVTGDEQRVTTVAGRPT